ncbi:hypothetical protein RCH06_001873 [Polaromonas sp. CG_9.5]|uniref:hypothetical protein n=1 Tax=Polaromonas sp. CG_9.5 TaxID=3071705 RepID=UPI002DF842DD|nr:hypothetical protein [Polaromonas sp. CG_9.5]
MTRIRLYDHPFAVVAPQVFEAPSLAEWLLAHYGDVPEVKVQIFKGEPSTENEISHDARAILAGDCAEYVILQSPGGFDPFTWAIIIAVAVTVATILLIPKPVLPGNINRTQQSPNNALGSRENQVRLLERVEDIYGTVKSIPSLMMPTYNKYIGHRKFEYGYYCVGRGYYSLSQLRDGDTLISDINGASAAVYGPFTSPNSGHAPELLIGDAIIDDVLTVSRAIEVDGLTLKAPNQGHLPGSAQYSYAPGGVITQTARQPNFNAVCAVGDQIAVVMDVYTIEVSPGFYENHDYTGTYTIVSVGDGTITVSGMYWPVTIPADLITADPPPPDTGGSA